MTTSENQRVEELYQFGPFRVDPARETLLKEGVAVPLTPKTFQILLVLVRHGKEIVTKDDLMKTVWPDTFVEEANLSRNIFMLRKALGETAQDHRYIVTVPGRGYRLAEHVHLVPGQEFAIAAASHTRVRIEVKETKPWKWIAAFAYAGQLQKARVSSRRAVDQARLEGQPERAGMWEAGASLREALFGEAPQARQRAKAALDHSNNREVQFGTALAFAISGDAGRAQVLADDLEKRFSEDTVVCFGYLPVIRARLALNQGNPAKALKLLQTAAPYELGASRLLFGALYPIYMRGEALLAAHEGAEAAIQFQRILDHRGVVGSDPIGALAHLQLGRAFILAGDQAKARAAYDDFFNLWKEADPDVPILKRARTEYLTLD
jgi:DNA-binding winged helix-turn-helix (wHTH) protein